MSVYSATCSCWKSVSHFRCNFKLGENFRLKFHRSQSKPCSAHPAEITVSSVRKKLFRDLNVCLLQCLFAATAVTPHFNALLSTAVHLCMLLNSYSDTVVIADNGEFCGTPSALKVLTCKVWKLLSKNNRGP